MLEIQPIRRRPELRIVMNHGCSENCAFCHNEGLSKFGANTDYKEVINFLKKLLGSPFKPEVIHLTGGEPTLNPEIVDLVIELKKMGFKVKITTNGNYQKNGSPDMTILDRLIDAGIDGINFSLHAITPENFQVVQGLNQIDNPKIAKWCQVSIESKLAAINRALERGVVVNINTVVISLGITGEMVDWALENNLSLRLMLDLNQPNESQTILDQILKTRNLEPSTQQIVINGGSGGSKIAYQQNGQPTPIKVRLLQKRYLPPICDACPLKNTPKCREFFYSMRLITDLDDKLKVSLCIDRHDPDVLIDVDEFLRDAVLVNAIAHLFS